MTSFPIQAFDILTQVRAKAPRVHCITNWAAMNLTPNMLLAVGAIPSLTFAPLEVVEFVEKADALLVNCGTLDETRLAAIPLAIKAIGSKPFVLDPVFAERSDIRRQHALNFLALNPTVLRGNAAEIAVLPANPHTLIAQTGAIDCVGSYKIHNGHLLMSRVTAMGCAGSAVIAASLSVEKNVELATASALVWLGVAGELAAAKANGVGTFPAHFLDCLYNLTQQELETHARFEFKK